MFEIDTGAFQPETRATTSGIEHGQKIVVTNYARARSTFNKIKANIECQECPDALDDYMAREDLMLDALHLYDPTVAAELREIYQDHRSCLVCGGVASLALPDTPESPTAPSGKNGNEGKNDVCIW